MIFKYPAVQRIGNAISSTSVINPCCTLHFRPSKVGGAAAFTYRSLEVVCRCAATIAGVRRWFPGNFTASLHLVPETRSRPRNNFPCLLSPMSSSLTAIDTLNGVLASTGYSCKHVCLDYASRGEKRGALFSYGLTNITDAYLAAKGGAPLCTVRSDRWNEKFVEVPASDVTLLTGNCDSDGELRHISLSEFLHAPVKFGAAYTGMDSSTSLSDSSIGALRVRFETVFLPIREGDVERGEMQFAVRTYSTLVQNQLEPRNLMLLATAEGLSVQADGTNAKGMHLHMGSSNEVNEYWLKLGSPTSTNDELRETATGGDEVQRRGSSGGGGIGVGWLKTQPNVLMVVQVPLVWNPASFVVKSSGGVATSGAQPAPSPALDAPVMSTSDPVVARDLNVSTLNKTNASTRISRGDFYARHKGLSKKHLQRKEMENIIVNCIIIKTVASDVPSEADVLAAVVDMESLYKKSAESNSSHPLFGSTTPNATGSSVLQNISARTPVAPPAVPSVLTPVASSAQTPATRTVQHFVAPVVRTPVAPPVQTSAAPPVQALSARAIQSPIASSVQAHVPFAASRLQSVSNIVMTKLRGLASMQTLSETSILEIRLLTIGALRSKSIKTLLERKFSLLSDAVSSGNGSGAKELLLELELIVQGSFDMLEMDTAQDESSSA